MKGILYKADGNKENIEVNCWKELQFFVGGDAERIGYLHGNFFCNEEGLVLELRPNPHFLYNIHGDVVELFEYDKTNLPFDSLQDRRASLGPEDKRGVDG